MYLSPFALAKLRAFAARKESENALEIFMVELIDVVCCSFQNLENENYEKDIYS